MLIAGSTVEGLLEGAGFIPFGIAFGLIAKYWYPYVESHPPKEGTRLHALWKEQQPYQPLYHLLAWSCAVGFTLAGLGVMAVTIYRALAA